MHYSVYVIDLHPDVLKHKRFADRNPHCSLTMPCVYVGMTGLTVKQRFANHRNGVKSNSYVTRYGRKLLPALYRGLNPMSYADAQRIEVELAGKLRRKGYAVWQN